MAQVIIRSMTDYSPPTTAELEAMIRPLPPRQRSEAEKAEAAIKAEKILLDNAQDIAKELVDLALSAKSEKVRLEAAKYVIDRLAGRVPLAPQPDTGEGKETWEGIIGTVIREPSKYELEGTVVNNYDNKSQDF